MTPPLVLASTSRYRRALMERLGLPFTVDSPRCDEEVGDETDPVAIVRELSLRKARSVAGLHPGAVVIGSDQVLEVGGAILTKPGTADRARAQLARLSGRTHAVITGWTVGRHESSWIAHRESTRVTFHELGDEEIAGYVATGEGMDKAGAYAIQEIGAFLVSRIEGDYFNVVGLPISRVIRALVEVGALERYPGHD